MTSEMYVIQITAVLVVLTCVSAQRWPKEGSCAPCHCSLQAIKYTYGVVKYVNCSNLGLITVPSNLPTDLNFLDLSHNNIDITTIDSVCEIDSLQFLSLAYNIFTTNNDTPFLECSLLVKLDLTGSSIFHLGNGTFKGLDNLQTIYGLEAESVEHGVFEKMHKLETLEFIFLGDTIPETIFTGLPVETLILTLNMVVKIPVGLFEFGDKTLQFLSIDGPNVRFLYENLFRGQTVLRKVSMHMPKLVSLPERLFSNFGVVANENGDPRNLREIILRSMNTIPGTIFNDLESLQRLEIHNVREVAIGGLFDDLVNLEVLNLTNSRIIRIPSGWFSKLYSLKTLKLRNCSLQVIEDQSLIGLMNLKTLDLSMNVIRKIPLKTFDPLRNSIQNLHLRGNILKFIDNQLLRQMLALQYLDLSDNNIRNISDNAFVDLKLLNFLQLQENKLAFLPFNLFLQQQNLQMIHLGENLFTRIPLFALKSTGFLLRLYLPNNWISFIPRTLPTDLPYLQYLSLLGNNLQCRCRLLSIRLYKPNLYIDGLCAAPRAVFGRHVMSLAIPQKCEGPRPKPEIKSEVPLPTPTSTVPLHSPSGYYDYKDNHYYYYYGSDEYYAYETEQYYLNLQSEENIPLTSSPVMKTAASDESLSTETGQMTIFKSKIGVDTIQTSESVPMLSTEISHETTNTYGSPPPQGSNTPQFYDSTTDLYPSSEALYNTSSLLPTVPILWNIICPNETKSTCIITASIAEESKLTYTSQIVMTSPPSAKDSKPTISDKSSVLSILPTSVEGDSIPQSTTPGQITGASTSFISSVQPTDHTNYSATDERSMSSSSSSEMDMILPTSSDDFIDNTAVMEIPGGKKKPETVITGISPAVKGIVGCLGVLAVMGICCTLWWLKNQVARRRMYEVTPSNTVV